MNEIRRRQFQADDHEKRMLVPYYIRRFGLRAKGFFHRMICPFIIANITSEFHSYSKKNAEYIRINVSVIFLLVKYLRYYSASDVAPEA